jgi:hypothetical protein
MYQDEFTKVFISESEFKTFFDEIIRKPNLSEDSKEKLKKDLISWLNSLSLSVDFEEL